MKNKISGKLKRIIKTITSLIGTGILSNEITTNWANFIYNSQGKRFRNFFVEYFDNSKITKLFHWKVPSTLWRNTSSISERRKEFILPVLPENQITWNIALSLLWAETGIANLCQIYIQKSQANKVFFDVGSNFGIRSYPFLTAGYDCVLFEPQNLCNQYVLKVAEINNFNLKIEQAVLSDKDEFIDFYVSKSTWFSSLSKESVELHEHSEKIKVKSILLDNYCEKYKIFPSIVKIDVEGFEWQVLQGSKKLIEERTPTLIIEIWHNNPSKSDIFNYLIQQNYQIFSINQEYLMPINTLASFMACNQPDYAFIYDPEIIKHINITSN